MRRGLVYMASGIMMLVAMVGCINNDVPYPVVKLDIMSLEAEGLTSPVTIDNTSRKVLLSLEETTDIRNVKITNVQFTDGARSSVNFPGLHKTAHYIPAPAAHPSRGKYSRRKFPAPGP